MQAVPLAPSHNVAEEAIDNESEIALFFFSSSFLKQQHCVSAWLEYLGIVAPLNGAVYHHSLSGAVGVLLLNHSLWIYFARSSNEDCILFCDIFSNWKISLCLYFALIFLYCHLTLKYPFICFLIDISQARPSKWIGLSFPGSVCFFPPCLLFPNHSVLPWLDRFIKNHSFRPFEYMLLQNFRMKITSHLDLPAVSSLSFGTTSDVLLCVSTDLFWLTFLPVPPLSASFR